MADIPVKKTGFLAVCCTALAGIAAAQAPSVRFGLGGGAIVPVGDYEIADKIGWHGLGMVQVGLPPLPVDIRVDALYGQTAHKDIGNTPVSGNTKLYGGLANVVYSIGPKVMARPYVLGGIGVYHVKVDVPGSTADETKFAFGVGGGVSVGMGQTHFFVEGRFVSVRESGGSTSFLPVTAGVSFGK